MFAKSNKLYVARLQLQLQSTTAPHIHIPHPSAQGINHPSSRNGSPCICPSPLPPPISRIRHIRRRRVDRPPPAAARAAPPITSIAALKEVGGIGAFDSNPDDFDLLFYLIELVKLPAFDTAVSGAPFTLFAPNDGAIIQTAIDFKIVGADADESTVALALVAELERFGRLNGQSLSDLLAAFLNYHFSPTTISSAQLLQKTEIKTLVDGKTITRGQPGVDAMELTDVTPQIANARIISTDLYAFGGVIHTIDRMLVALPLAGGDDKTPITMLAQLQEAGGVGGGFDDDTRDFDVLFHFAQLANLSSFDGGGAPFTLFAPNDGAFILAAKDLKLVGDGADEAAAADAIVRYLGGLGDLKAILITVLKYHVAVERLEINGTYWELQEEGSASLLEKTEIKALAEGLTITRGQEGVDPLELTDQSDRFPDPKIIDRDLFTFGGVVHTIDRMLLLKPSQFAPEGTGSD